MLKHVAPGNQIPRVIHQTYTTGRLPEALETNRSYLRELNRNWDVRFYDDDARDAYVRKHFGARLARVVESIDSRYGAARADFFRYLLIYNEGGCYLDIKSSMSRPIDEGLLPDDRYILSQWNNNAGEKYEGWGMLADIAHIAGGEYQQWHLIAVPGHPLLRRVILQVIQNIESYRPEHAGVGALGVWRLAGPIPYSLVVDKYRHLYPHRKVHAQSDLGLIYNIFHGPGRIDESNRNGHHKTFQNLHYSQLTSPIVRLNWYRRMTWLQYSARKKLRMLLARAADRV